MRLGLSRKDALDLVKVIYDKLDKLETGKDMVVIIISENNEDDYDLQIVPKSQKD